MAHFYAFVENIAIKRTLGNEDGMISNQTNGTTDDSVIKSSTDVIITNQLRVACNGGGGPLGHPQIFLTLGNDGRVVCPYCSREFIKSDD